MIVLWLLSDMSVLTDEEVKTTSWKKVVWVILLPDFSVSDVYSGVGDEFGMKCVKKQICTCMYYLVVEAFLLLFWCLALVAF